MHNCWESVIDKCTKTVFEFGSESLHPSGFTAAIGSACFVGFFGWNVYNLTHFGHKWPSGHVTGWSFELDFNLIPGGGLQKPPSCFSYAIAKHFELSSWNFLTFPKYPLRTFWRPILRFCRTEARPGALFRRRIGTFSGSLVPIDVEIFSDMIKFQNILEAGMW